MIDVECLRCDCYDPDYECTMSSLDKSYACPLDTTFEKEIKKEVLVQTIISHYMQRFMRVE